MTKKTQIKPPMEIYYKEELEVLKKTDKAKKPENWQMSPQAVRTFILGSKTPISYKGKEYKDSLFHSYIKRRWY